MTYRHIRISDNQIFAGDTCLITLEPNGLSFDEGRDPTSNEWQDEIAGAEHRLICQMDWRTYF